MLEALLWDCFEGPSKCEADGLAAAIQRLPAHTVALGFRLDSSAFRKAVGLTGDRCCDRLLLVLQRPPAKETRATLLLIEMKGGKHTDALEQLETTLDALRSYLRERLTSHAFSRTDFIAVVISDRASQSEERTVEEKHFRRKHGARLYTLRGQRVRQGRPAPSVDLTELLRPMTATSS